MKKLWMLLLTVVLVTGIAGCGSESENAGTEDTAINSDVSQDGEEASTTAAEVKTLKIAMVMFDWADDQGQYLQQCGAYLEENFPVEFDYITTGTDADEVVNTVQELVTAEYDGIINAMTPGFQAWSAICEENGVYYSILLNTIDEDDKAYAEGLEYFVGSAQRSDFTQLGVDFANQAIDAGLENVLFAGFAEGMLPSVDQVAQGFTQTMDAQSQVMYKKITQYPDNLFPAITAELASKGFDGIVCPVSVMDFGVGNIFANDLVGQTVAIGHNIDASTDDAMGTGVVLYLTDNLTSIVNMNYVMIANAVYGQELSGTPEGYWNIEVPSLVIDSPEKLEEYRTYVRSVDESNPTYAFDADDVALFLTYQNPEATFEDFEKYIGETTIEKIIERHAE